METKYSKNNIYSANLLLSDLFLKIKLILDQQISYLKIAENAINLTEPREIRDIYNVLQTPDNNVNLSKRMEYASLWFVDPNIKDTEENLDLYNQMHLVSLTNQTMYAGHKSLKGLITKFYFILTSISSFFLLFSSCIFNIVCLFHFRRYKCYYCLSL
jgi:hypothetical protein